MRGRRGWRKGRGGQHASVVSMASCAIYGACYIDTYIRFNKRAHVHFPHILSEVRVHIVSLLVWLVGNAVENEEKVWDKTFFKTVKTCQLHKSSTV